MKNLILKISASILIVAFTGTFTFLYVMDNEFHTTGQPAPASYVHYYETDEQFFYTGEILMPDYVHTDTLIVTNAQLLNDSIICNYEIGSDQEINDMLIKGTILYSNHTNTASK